MPPSTWREIQGRAATLGIAAGLSADGAELRLLADLPSATDKATETTEGSDPA